MGDWFRRLGGRVQRVWQIIVLFCVLRIVVGLGAVLLFDRDAIAWGPELTLIALGGVVVYVGVALAVRWWAPPRRPA